MTIMQAGALPVVSRRFFFPMTGHTVTIARQEHGSLGNHCEISFSVGVSLLFFNSFLLLFFIRLAKEQ